MDIEGVPLEQLVQHDLVQAADQADAKYHASPEQRTGDIGRARLNIDGLC
jgi:hypothetical protein